MVAQVRRDVGEVLTVHRGVGESGFESAMRLIAIAWATPDLRRLGVPTSEISSWLMTLATQIYLGPSRFSSANNHRLGELTALLIARTLCVRTQEVASLRDELYVTFESLFNSDGSGTEESPAYAAFAIDLMALGGMALTCLTGQSPAQPPNWAVALKWTADLWAHDRPLNVGDDSDDRVLRVVYFDDVRRPGTAALVPRGWTLPSGEAASSPPIRTYPVGRHGLMRRDFDGAEVKAVLLAGQLGHGDLAAHGHADQLSAVLAVGGREFLTDSGTGTYENSPSRRALRESAAHNVIMVGRASQARSAGPHLWRRTYGPGEIDVVDSGNGAIGQVLIAQRRIAEAPKNHGYHRRTLLYLEPANSFVILDDVRVANSAQVELVWHVQTDGWDDLPFSPRLLINTVEPAASRSTNAPISPRFDSFRCVERRATEVFGRRARFATVVDLYGRIADVTVTAHDLKIVVAAGETVRVELPRRAIL
ncbi:heparinase II/III-family protein [Thermoleophilia bacterium SCSIO 60948]|nr:heparinase II/III-family protein [Thermoleophilia bacterium SCSIO 60948]